jgi:HD-GYP domain-containing protein (c-di-GMP phosphodiesterase class II)
VNYESCAARLCSTILGNGVSNGILEKSGKRTAEEFSQVRQHPYHTYEILRRIPAFSDLSGDAALHHERLNGKGYWQGLMADALSLPARILAVADVFDALSAKRPYRDALPIEKVFSRMREDAPHALDWLCLDALMESRNGSEPNSISTGFAYHHGRSRFTKRSTRTAQSRART